MWKLLFHDLQTLSSGPSPRKLTRHPLLHRVARTQNIHTFYLSGHSLPSNLLFFTSSSFGISTSRNRLSNTNPRFCGHLPWYSRNSRNHPPVNGITPLFYPPPSPTPLPKQTELQDSQSPDEFLGPGRSAYSPLTSEVCERSLKIFNAEALAIQDTWPSSN